MPLRKQPATPADKADPEHSPDPLQMTGKDQSEDTPPQPTSGRKSMRSRYVPPRINTPAVDASPRTSASGRKRPQLDGPPGPAAEEPGATPSKRAKVVTQVRKAVVPVETPANSTTNSLLEQMIATQMQLNSQHSSFGTVWPSQSSSIYPSVHPSIHPPASPAKALHRPTPPTPRPSKPSTVELKTPKSTTPSVPRVAKQPVAKADTPKAETSSSRTSKRTDAKTESAKKASASKAKMSPAKKNAPEAVPTNKRAPAKPKTPSKRNPKAPVAPIRHSSNPLDEESRPEPAHPQIKPTEPDVLRELEEEREPRTGASFDLTSAQSRDAFLRNERWQRDKEARNFNFEGDVNEGRRLRSGKAVALAGTSDVGDEEDEGTIGDEDEADESAYEAEGKRHQEDLFGQTDAEFVADNDYLSQLTYDADMPVEAQKSGFADASLLEGSTPQEEEPSSRLLTPFAKRVLQTVISNLAGYESYSASGPMTLEEEKDESLRHLVNLLTGTVERGEGNSCLVLGAKGSGKTRTVKRAISIVRSASQSNGNGHPSSAGAQEDRRPIIVRLDGLAQTNDLLAIREMGRQISLGQGEKPIEDDDQDEDAVQAAETLAPTTLPAHLLAHLTAPSPRAIVVIMENFDLFTTHARQALLYCLLDVVQGVRTGPVASTGRGVAVIGVTSRMDTTLLLEKRVKSRFSQRIYRVVSPLSSNVPDTWRAIVREALVPESVTRQMPGGASDTDVAWLTHWESQVDAVLADETVEKAARRMVDLTTDVRILLRPFIRPVQQFGRSGGAEPLQPETIVTSISEQMHSTGWGKKLEKLRGLSHPSLVVLIIAKHFAFAGKEEFNLAMVEHEYQRFARTQLAGSGRARWSTGILETAWRHLMHVGLLFPATRYRPSTNPYMQRFILCRSLLTRSEIVAYFKGEGAKVLGTELTGWGRTAGGHA
ncbi:hypothetical protein NliqN6_0389 [Naganishia liquefaciens]|uniref:Origin recognition complex subunit 4 n=1 Tax=Naganishia liquefaciens TaxID=104408 RepID=A0A8H3TMS7_9TREE|nr:hypothetical protein NliqN6_0389 [Naganishia liquefaciens]